jgi:H+/Cl- antiporter ClcA
MYYVVTVVRVYFVIQLSGLFIAAVVESFDIFGFSRPFSTLFSTVPIAMLLGAVFTAIPTAIYAAVLPWLISLARRVDRRWWIPYAVSTLITSLVFLAIFLLLPDGGANVGTTEIRLLVAAILSGWLGTCVAVRRIDGEKSCSRVSPHSD